MKSRIKLVVMMTLLLTAVAPSKTMAEEQPLEAPVIEALLKDGEDTKNGPGVISESEIIAEDSSLFPDAKLPEAEVTKQDKAEVVSTVPSYTQEDLEILAHAICGEAQSYPDEEQLYVGSVIINRKNHRAYPNTIKEVVFQKGQYACTWDGNYYRQPTPANYKNAKWLLENGSVLPENVVYQAAFRQGSDVYLKTKYHKYCLY